MPRPWKNGRGVTRIVFDDADDADVWSWRISIAEISGSQPYSAYPGVHRDQVALGPGAVDLVVDGRAALLAVEGIISFEGESDVTATPREPGFLDLNVMTRRDCWTCSVHIVDGDTSVPESTGIAALIALADGTVHGRVLRRLDSALVLPGTSCTAVGRYVFAQLAPV